MADRLAAQGERQMTFLAGVAHDLRAPLTPLKVAAELGRQPDVLKDAGYVSRILDVVTRQVDHLERMAEDLLDAVRIEGGRLEIRPEPCDLRPIVSTVADLFAAQSREHTIELAMPETAVVARCDSVRIQQVLTNIVGNAIKYSPGGGTIAMTLSVEGAHASVAVADEGVGISERDLARLFQPFSRAPAVQSRIPGLGLGLSISRQLVQMHGGSLDVISRLGSGSTFTVRLPLTRSAAQEAEEQQSEHDGGNRDVQPITLAHERQR